MQIAFIGKVNQTNSIITEMLISNFDATVTYYQMDKVMEAFSTENFTYPELIIFDLNTSSGSGTAPSKITLLTDQFEGTPVLVVHPYQSKKLIMPLIEAGAQGIVSITPKEENFTKAVEQLLAGENFFELPR
ncbi:MAG: hypothetical protein WD361_07885 [Gracilimonas sp.]